MTLTVELDTSPGALRRFKREPQRINQLRHLTKDVREDQLLNEM